MPKENIFYMSFVQNDLNHKKQKQTTKKHVQGRSYILPHVFFPIYFFLTFRRRPDALFQSSLREGGDWKILPHPPPKINSQPG